MYEEFVEHSGTTCKKCGAEMEMHQSVNAPSPETQYAYWDCPECGNHEES